MAEVAINIITHNRSMSLSRCLASVERQTFKNYDVVVIDDGSTDDTATVIREQRIPINYERVPHCGNIPLLRNLALRKSTGRYIALLDSDDEWEPAKLTKQLRMMQATEALFSFTSARIVNEGHRDQILTVATGPYDKSLLPALFRSWFILPSSLLFQRDVFNVIGCFDESLVSASEVEFIVRALRSHPFLFLDEPLLIRHVHEEQHSTAHSLDAFMETLALSDQLYRDGFLSHADFRSIASHLHYSLGKELRARDQQLSSKEAFRQSFYLNPLNVRAALRWAFS